MRGNTLGNIRAMLKAEIGAFAGTNVQSDAELNQLLANEQQRIASEYPMFLEQRWDVVVNPGTQYVSLPLTTAGAPSQEGPPAGGSLNGYPVLDLDFFPTVEVYYNLIYIPVIYGIGAQEYNMLNFAKSQQSDPIQRWNIRSNINETSNPNQFEVWPVPLTPQTLRFTGRRALQELFQGTDAVDYITNTANYRASGVTARVFLDALTADLDDMLLVFFVAASRLARNKTADSTVMLQRAQRRLQTLTQNFPQRQVQRTLDGVDRQFKPRIQGMRIMVGGGGSSVTPGAYTMYYGVSANTILTDVQILALTSATTASRSLSTLFSPAAQYIYLSYPTSLGAASFTVNGFPNTAWILTIVIVNSISYNVYRSLNLLTGTNIAVVLL